MSKPLTVLSIQIISCLSLLRNIKYQVIENITHFKFLNHGEEHGGECTRKGKYPESRIRKEEYTRQV